jgi:hypothetical protein
MLCNEILYVLGREMTGGLADEGPALFNYAAAAGTARMLGLTVPPTLLSTADEVIE